MGAALLNVATHVGGIGILAGRLFTRLLPLPSRRFRPALDVEVLMKSLHAAGNRSLPIVALTAIFVGGIMVVQATPLVQRYGATSIVGWGAGYAILREIGPILIALMFNGRVGANNTAELGTMVVTEQIDALRTLAIDPLGYLALPRCVAMVAMLFGLTIIGDIIALVGASLAAGPLLGVGTSSFWNGLLAMLDEWDLMVGLIKSIVFGVVIALSSTYFGLKTSGGAPGVGRAVNASVVASAAGIFALDFLSTFALG
ncbi:MAG: ABC transporter permease [Deltaproteobacteria bacterium]|nr:ABC transporter permease [Deltaproteobacteria bacterium]